LGRESVGARSWQQICLPRAIRRAQQINRQLKPVRNIIDHLAKLRSMRGDSSLLGVQLRCDAKPPTTDRCFFQHSIVRQRPPPHRVRQVPHVGNPCCFGSHPSGGGMDAMGIKTPGRHDCRAIESPQTRGLPNDNLIECWAAVRRLGIGFAQERKPLGWQHECLHGTRCFRFSQGCQLRRWVTSGAGMRSTTISQDHHHRRSRFDATPRNQTTASEALVIRMRRQNETIAGTDHIAQATDG
jgi:hypothetical protein